MLIVTGRMLIISIEKIVTTRKCKIKVEISRASVLYGAPIGDFCALEAKYAGLAFLASVEGFAICYRQHYMSFANSSLTLAKGHH